MVELIPKHRVLGTVTNDPWGEASGTDYKRFQSPVGIVGLTKFTDNRLDLFVVMAITPRRGKFRQFIHLAKSNFSEIYIWRVWSKILHDALVRYKFTKITAMQNKEVLDGLYWRVKKW